MKIFLIIMVCIMAWCILTGIVYLLFGDKLIKFIADNLGKDRGGSNERKI